MLQWASKSLRERVVSFDSESRALCHSHEDGGVGAEDCATRADRRLADEAEV